MKIALVHDDLVQWGGAERVLVALSELFPEAPIYTSLYNKDNPLLKQHFKNKRIITSFLQKIPFAKSFYKVLLPFYPLAFEQFDFSEYDLVISQTTRFAKCIITKPHTKHVCYCHTPPRFLWKFSGDNAPKFLAPLISWLRLVDTVSSKRVDQWIAGSFNAQQRIKKIYKVDSLVIQPFVDLKNLDQSLIFDGGYFLIISRLNNYKKVEIAVEAFNKLGLSLKVVGIGPNFGDLKKRSKSNVEFLGQVKEEALISLLAGCKALILTAEEDFGLTPIEAQAFGKPVIAYGVGGSLETVVEGKTGIFFKEQTAVSLIEAVERFNSLKFDPKNGFTNAQKFSKEKFKDKFLKTAIG